MKKILTFAIAIIMLLTVSLGAMSCNSENEASTTSAVITPEATTPEATTPAVTTPEATTTEETEPEDDEPEPEPTELHINTAADLVALNESIVYNKDYDGYTIYIDSDIDMTGIEWKALNGYYLYNTVFEGNGHTISNLNIVPNDRNTTRVGFVDIMDGGAITFQNLTFKNCTTTADDANGVGIILGCSLKSEINFKNVHVLDSKVITGTKYVSGADSNKIGIRLAAFLGYSHENSEVAVNSCSVKNFEAEGFHNIACFVGFDSSSNSSVNNCAVENVTLKFSYCFANSYSLEQDKKYVHVFYGIADWVDTLDTALSNGNTYSNVKFIDLESGTELAPEDFRTVSAK